jgi:ATP adenylyltransferase
MTADTENDEANLVVYRGTHNFIVLNLYPYITGHLLIVPYQHPAELDSVAKEITDELMDLAKKAQNRFARSLFTQRLQPGNELRFCRGCRHC